RRGAPRLLLGDPHLPARPGPARRRARAAARPAPRRDGRSAARAGGPARPAQRARPRGAGRRRPRRTARRRARGGRARDDAQRPPAVPAAGRRVSDADAVLDLAVRLARAAGRLQRERYETRFEVRVKGTPLDLVTEVDHACEKLIVEGIASERPA